MGDDEVKTYDEWNALGRRVHKGQRATGFRDRKPLFRQDQTYDYRANGKEMQEAYDNSWRFSRAFGVSYGGDIPPNH